VKYLILDARYEKVRHGGSIVDCSVLLAIGVDAEGRRSVLGVSVSLSEAEVHWREFFKSLIERGLHGVELITSDAHAGLAEARKACFPGVPWQRCQFHLMRNALAHVPREDMKREVMDDLRSVLDSADEHAAGEQLRRVARKYEKSAPKLAEWMEENVPESFAVFRLPPAHRARLRTTNMLERLKRRTRVATLFPNEASLLRLVTAVLMEISEEWETGKRYPTFETKSAHPTTLRHFYRRNGMVSSTHRPPTALRRPAGPSPWQSWPVSPASSPPVPHGRAAVGLLATPARPHAACLA
jgi:transposase-like protein